MHDIMYYLSRYIRIVIMEGRPLYIADLKGFPIVTRQFVLIIQAFVTA